MSKTSADRRHLNPRSRRSTKQLQDQHDRRLREGSRAAALGDECAGLTMQRFSPHDHEIAKRTARALGFKQFVYTDTSSLWGLFCLAENPEYAKAGQAIRNACIIKTSELGFLVINNLEDLGLDPNGRSDNGRAVTPAVKGGRS